MQQGTQIVSPVPPAPTDGQLEQYDRGRRDQLQQRRPPRFWHPNQNRSFTLLLAATVFLFSGVCWSLWGREDSGPAVRKMVLKDDKAGAIEALVQEDKRNFGLLYGIVLIGVCIFFGWLFMCTLNNQEFRDDALNEVTDLKSTIQEQQMQQVQSEKGALAREKEKLEKEKAEVQAEKAQLQQKAVQLKQELVATKYKLNGEKETNNAVDRARESMMRAADEARERQQARERELEQRAGHERARAAETEKKDGSCVIQ